LIGDASTDDLGLLKSCIQIEFTFYKLVRDMEMFRYKWGINQCICDVDEDGCLELYI